MNEEMQNYERLKENWQIDNAKHMARHKTGLTFRYLQTKEDGTLELGVYNLSKWQKELNQKGKTEAEIDNEYLKLKQEFSTIVKHFLPAQKLKPSEFFKILLDKKKNFSNND